MAVRPIQPIAIASLIAAPTLPPPRRGDAAWLTLLAAQAYGERPSADHARACSLYAVPERDEAPIFAFRA